MKVCRPSFHWLTILLVFLCHTSMAQQQNTINGTVLDATTRQALPG